MISKRLLVYLVLAAFALGGAYLLFGSSKERRVLAVLQEMASAMSSLPGETQEKRARRIQLACDEHLADSFVLVAPEVGIIEGKQTATQLSALGSPMGLEMTIKESDVRVGEGSRARASLLLEVTFRPTGEERREQRSATVELVERAGDYLIERVEVTGPSKDEPEARP